MTDTCKNFTLATTSLRPVTMRGNIADLDPVGILFMKVCGLDCLTRSCYKTKFIN